MDKQTLYKLPTDKPGLSYKTKKPLARFASNDTETSTPLTEINLMRTINIGKERVCIPTLMKKICTDISYLNNRLDQLEKYEQQNSTTKNNYLNMLSNRKSVLAWIESQMPQISKV